MAVVRARNIHAKPEIWEHGCNNTPLLPSESVSTLNMSYQYIAPPPHDPAMDYNPGFRIVPQDSSAPEGDGRDSEGSYDDSPGTGLRRSFSTPNATQMQHHGASGQQAAAGASGEKKRNKLGYHRTSIACSESPSQRIRALISGAVADSSSGRSLSPAKNSMYRLPRRSEPMRELHSIEKGMQFLSCRSATRRRKPLEGDRTSNCRLQCGFLDVVPCGCRWQP